MLALRVPVIKTAGIESLMYPAVPAILDTLPKQVHDGYDSAPDRVSNGN